MEQNTQKEKEILEQFSNKFGNDMISMLHKMGDFYLFEFTPFYGEAVFGFGKAYNLGGENFEEFVDVFRVARQKFKEITDLNKPSCS